MITYFVNREFFAYIKPVVFTSLNITHVSLQLSIFKSVPHDYVLGRKKRGITTNKMIDSESEFTFLTSLVR